MSSSTMISESGDRLKTAIKANYLDDRRRFHFEGDFISLKAYLGKVFGISLEDIAIKYIDSEGDHITIACDSDLNELLFDKPEILHLVISKNTNATSSSVSNTTISSSTDSPNVPLTVDSPVAVFDQFHHWGRGFGGRRWGEGFGGRRWGEGFGGRGCGRGKMDKGQRKARFVSDVTIPKNTDILPGTKFIKTWRVRNDCRFPWNSGYLSYIPKPNCDQMNGPAYSPLSPNTIVNPGHTIDVSVPLVAPSQPGKYKGVWSLCDSQGVMFGQKLKIVIRVVLENKSDSSPEEDIYTTLEKMGYTDKNENLRIVAGCKGNFHKCVKKLLKIHEKK